MAPPLLWPEVRSALHQQVWRGAISRQLGLRALEQLENAPIAMKAPAALGRTAWQIAEEFGWAKTYDAEYVALARLLGTRLLTLDRRLLRATGPQGLVIAPEQL